MGRFPEPSGCPSLLLLPEEGANWMQTLLQKMAAPGLGKNQAKQQAPISVPRGTSGLGESGGMIENREDWTMSPEECRETLPHATSLSMMQTHSDASHRSSLWSLRGWPPGWAHFCVHQAIAHSSWDRPAERASPYPHWYTDCPVQAHFPSLQNSGSSCSASPGA